MPESLNKSKLEKACRILSTKYPELAFIVDKYGPPPLWDRPRGFPTLLHIILEQQVSLASAKACFDKLCLRVGQPTPESVIDLSDAELRTDGFSRQKAAYARRLAQAVAEGSIDLAGLDSLSDEHARNELKKLKGVGDWTADIYLLMAMLRPDVMPKGDLALHIAWERLTGEPRPDSIRFLEIAERWRPYRSVAARLLWHFYLNERGRVTSDE